MDQSKTDISKNILVPKHSKLKESEHKLLLDQYNIAVTQLPKILKSDPAIQQLEPNQGDIIKIERKEGDKIILYYRVII